MGHVFQESKCSEASPRSVASAEAAGSAPPSVAPAEAAGSAASAAERGHAELQASLATKKKLPNFVPPRNSPPALPPRASADRPSLLALAVKRQHLQQMLLGFFFFVVTGCDILMSSHRIQGSRLPR